MQLPMQTPSVVTLSRDNMFGIGIMSSLKENEIQCQRFSYIFERVKFY
jgi:hypothetical protein